MRQTYAQRLAATLEQTTLPMPETSIQSGRITSMAEVLAQVGTDSNHELLLALARMGLAMFGFDDLVDKGGLPLDDVVVRGEQLIACAAGRWVPEVGYDPIAQLLHEVADHLRRQPLATMLWPDWTRATREVLRAIVSDQVMAERLWAGIPMGMEEVLELGRRSVGFEPLAVATWIVLGSESLEDSLDLLRKQARHLSRAVRLANDLCSARRDDTDQNANVLFVLGPEGNAVVSVRLLEELEAAAAMTRSLPPDAEDVGHFVENLGRAIVRLYLQRDFHERDRMTVPVDEQHHASPTDA